MEIVIPLEGDDKRIGVLKNVKNDDGGWFGSDKTTFDVYLPAELKEELLSSLAEGKQLEVRSADIPFSKMMGASVNMNRDTYIKQYHLEQHKEEIKALFEQAYRLKPTPRLIATPGSSKMGGEPDMPAGIKWPESNGKPMSFIMQLNLAQFKIADKKGEGYLYLFMDLSQADSTQGDVTYKLVHYPKKTTVKRVKYPEEFPGDLKISESALRASLFPMVPEEGSSSVRKLSLNDEDRDNYNTFRNTFVNIDFNDLFSGGTNTSDNQFLGYPATSTDIQLYSEMDAEGKKWSDSTAVNDSLTAVLTPAAAKWRVLLQVDFEKSPLSSTGLGGKYYFMIRKSDLEKGKLENTRMYFEDYGD
jgi:uncharacterized protein YwqG